MTPMPWPVVICIAGAQTGADQAFLRAAKLCRYITGGMMPYDWMTEDGPRPDLAAAFNLEMSHSSDYDVRTRWNVRNSTGTLVFTMGKELDGGSLLTMNFARSIGKVCLHVQVIPGTKLTCIPSIDDIRQWITVCEITTLNGAGNRESKSPGIGVAVEALCLEILRKP